MDKIDIRITKEYDNFTIKEYLKANNVGRGKVEEIRVNKQAYLNGNNVSIDTIVHENDLVSFGVAEKIDFKEEESNLEVVYEDEYLIAVNKTPNMIIHPDSKDKIGTLVNQVAYYYKKNGINRKVRYIHRIDKETSGLVLFAKDFLSEAILLNDLNNRKLDRNYLAIVEGVYPTDYGTIKLNIGEDRHVNNKMVVTKTGKEAITKYKVFKKFDRYSLILFSLVTGRTHQIRVHTSFLGHPILGDLMYGGNFEFIKRIALHSYEMEFTHPITKKVVNIKCEPPEDMKKLLRK